ncbi:MAG: site-specific DNA-methyltransferase [Bacteroidetes bacterium]|nr:site-specific DNA-methyltransferase [Bacteroidota bacterium]MBT7492842.1 site-specific DNA-methyltransferase [Bacteroidota bacterium]
MINFHNIDCMDFMKQKPENYYDLAIVDPPYGIGADRKNSIKKKQSKKSASLSKYYGNQKWDANIPSDEYFSEVKRVSEKQIIWGANYLNLQGGMLYWHKNVTMPTYSSGELAYLSWKNKIDFIEITWHGMLQQNMKNKQKRIHPTEKPIQLYRWLLQNYAKEGDKILDTHGGSGSIAIACNIEGFDLDICEIDKDYFEASKKRFNIHKSQLKLF